MEKTGNLEKLEYNFDTTKNLEVFMSALDGWFRVTSKVFRSFNGKRRIQGEEYKGPTYLYGTNKIMNTEEKDSIVGYNWVSVRRPGEDF